MSDCHDPAPAPVAASRQTGGRTPLIAVMGNPNTGKTTLFNRLTGQNARVGNYPGITVERRVGSAKLGAAARTVELLDVPGTYSLNARSPEEEIAIESALGLSGNPEPDLVLAVLDATQLGRNIYLVLQLLELEVPLVLALNMMDEVGESGVKPEALEAIFGVPCVGISARYGLGVPRLKLALAEALTAPRAPGLMVPYGPALAEDISRVAEALPPEWGSSPGRRRGLALWTLLSVDEDDELTDLPPALRERALAVQRAAAAAGRDLDCDAILPRFTLIDERWAELHRAPPPRNTTERVDRVLLHPVYGFAFFLAFMVVVFQSLFSWADPAIGLIEDAFGALGQAISATLPASWITDLIVQGLVGGVGNVIVFLPQILLLFFFIGVLEDTGYMARVAYLMDRIMRSLGLHGRAFVPMMSGYACAVPAIMATRTMERKRDRYLTMLVVPLMSCSARLPVYTLLIGALFPPSHIFGVVPVQGLMMVAMYLFSTAMALAAAGVIGRTVLKGKRVPLILELPPYRLPSLGSVVRLMWERSRLFLTEAGTVILACTVVLWGLLHYPKLPEPGPEAPPEVVVQWQADSLEASFAGHLGHAIEPAIAPLGFDWKIGVGLIGAFAAREVFVSTMGLVYGVGDEVDEQSPSLRDRMRAETRSDGKPVYTPLVGVSLMVFFALACQCMSTLAVVKRETRGWRWPAFLLGYMTVLAWGCSFLVYQGGRLLGFA